MLSIENREHLIIGLFKANYFSALFDLKEQNEKLNQLTAYSVN